METRKPERKAHSTSYDSGTPQALVDFMATGWLDAPVTAAAIPQMEEYRARRRALSQAFPGEFLVIPSGTEKTRANDTNFRFRPSSDFAYLAGAGEPGGLLVLEPARKRRPRRAAVRSAAQPRQGRIFYGSRLG